MNVSFACPNGHPLNAPEHLAGKPGKCPHCGMRFLIPTLDEIAQGTADEVLPSSGKSTVTSTTTGTSEPPPTEPARTVPPRSLPPRTESPRTPAAANAPNATRPNERLASAVADKAVETIYFTCPQGHKLNGPSGLRGKLGKCPHCATQFRIPSDATATPHGAANVTSAPTTSAPPAPQPPTPSRHAAHHGVATSGSTLDVDDDIAEGRLVDDADLHGDLGREPTRDDSVASRTSPSIPSEAELASESRVGRMVMAWSDPPPSDIAHLAQLFAWLWQQRDPNSIVELQLKDCGKFTPTWFSAELSQQEFGVFAGQDDDDHYTMTVIPWSGIERIELRHLEVIPLDLFT